MIVEPPPSDYGLLSMCDYEPQDAIIGHQDPLVMHNLSMWRIKKRLAGCTILYSVFDEEKTVLSYTDDKSRASNDP